MLVDIYVLKLECDKYYVGKISSNHATKSIFYDSVIKAEWSKIEWLQLYKPKDIIKMYINQEFFHDEIILYQYMKKYGIDNVRGSIYTDVILSHQVKEFILRKIHELEKNQSLLYKLKRFFHKKIKHKEIDKLYYQL